MTVLLHTTQATCNNTEKWQLVISVIDHCSVTITYCNTWAVWSKMAIPVFLHVVACLHFLAIAKPATVFKMYTVDWMCFTHFQAYIDFSFVCMMWKWACRDLLEADSFQWTSCLGLFLSGSYNIILWWCKWRSMDLQLHFCDTLWKTVPFYLEF